MKKKAVSKKNYIIFSLLVVFTVFICLYLSSWYKTINDYYKNNSIISDVLSEIEVDSFSSYILDNPDILIYISSSKDVEIKSFEKQLKKIIINNDLSDQMIFIDTSKEENLEVIKIIKDNLLSEKYASLKKINVPSIICFKNGKVTNILSIKNKDVTKSEINLFLRKCELISD